MWIDWICFFFFAIYNDSIPLNTICICVFVRFLLWDSNVLHLFHLLSIFFLDSLLLLYYNNPITGFRCQIIVWFNLLENFQKQKIKNYKTIVVIRNGLWSLLCHKVCENWFNCLSPQDYRKTIYTTRSRIAHTILINSILLYGKCCSLTWDVV